MSQTKVRLNHAQNLTQLRSHIQIPRTLCYFRSTFNTYISSHQLFGVLWQGEDIQGYESKQIKPRTCLHDCLLCERQLPHFLLLQSGTVHKGPGYHLLNKHVTTAFQQKVKYIMYKYLLTDVGYNKGRRKHIFNYVTGISKHHIISFV